MVIAVRMHEHGGPEVLRYEAAPDPTPGPADVLVRVRACALNHLDLWTRRGGRGWKLDLPHILGADVAGEVAATGELVREFKVGDPVLLNPGVSCGRCEACLSGWDTLCPDYAILGSGPPGGYAQYVVVPGQNVIPKPPNLSWEEAAALPLTFLTAWHMVMTLARVRPGETVLVLGAGSGVGAAAIQIARLAGARVIATAGTPAKLDAARRLGADEVINHAEESILERVKALTDRRGVQVVIEHVGQATWEDSIKSLAPRGRLVTCGATTGPDGKTDIRYVFARQLQIFGSYMGSKSELLALMPLVREGRLRPVVDRVLPLAEAAEAHRLMEGRAHFGKLVLVPPDGQA